MLLAWWTKAVAKGPILRPWPDQFWAKKKRKRFKTKIIQLQSRHFPRLRSVKTSQLCDGKSAKFSKASGALPRTPLGGLQRLPDPQLEKAPCCARLVLLRNVLNVFVARAIQHAFVLRPGPMSILIILLQASALHVWILNLKIIKETLMSAECHREV